MLGEPFVLGPEDGEQYFLGPRGAPVCIKVSPQQGSTRIAVGTEDIAPGDQIPVHRHEQADEIIFIHRGTAVVLLGGQRIEAPEGSTIFVPSGVWHGISNESQSSLRMLWMFAPPGMDGYFREFGVPVGAPRRAFTAEEMDALEVRYAITYLPRDD